MALAHTDRGDTTAADSTPAPASLASASFTPASGALLTVCIKALFNDSGDGSGTFTMSTTGFTTSGWTVQENHALNVGSGYSLKTFIATATTTSSALGTVVATKTGLSGGTGEGTYDLQVDEWTGQAGSPIGLHASVDDALASGSTLTVGFGGTPVATSGTVGVVSDNNGSTTGAVQPTGWTETMDRGDAGSGTSSDAAFILTGAAASPQWTAMQSGTFGKTGSVLEVLEASATLDVPLLRPIPQYNVHRM